jgi:hypothetical protein
MDLVKVVNRSQRKLGCTWDGKRYMVEPGESVHPRLIAEALRRSNPIFGSDDPITGELQYLIAIPDYGDSVTPIEQSDEIELYHRSKEKNAIPIMVIPGNTRMTRPQVASDAFAPTGGPVETGFVKP